MRRLGMPLLQLSRSDMAMRSTPNHVRRARSALSGAGSSPASTAAPKMGHRRLPGWVGAASQDGSGAARLRELLTRRFEWPMVGSLSISEIAGHSAFLLAGTAFLDPDVLHLRVLSVASGAANLVFTYFHPTGAPLWLPFRYNILFMAINMWHILNIVGERREAANMPPQAIELWKTVFELHGVSAVEFARLLHAGTWTTLRKGTALQQEGQDSASVFLVVSGGASVSFGGGGHIRMQHVHHVPERTPGTCAPYSHPYVDSIFCMQGAHMRACVHAHVRLHCR